MKFINVLRLVALATAFFIGNVFANEPQRPNILVILTDDMGYADVGFNGSTDIVTPNLDQLAENGVVFSAAYNAHPFCGPSRAGLMTGRYPHKFGSQFNLPTDDLSGGLGIPENETFISKVLQDSGYFTGAVGKWHLGEVGKYHPNQRGFDEFYGFLNGGHQYFPEDFKPYYQQQVNKGFKHAIAHYYRPLEHNGKEVDETEYITDGLSREASKFIETAAQKKDQPFFLYLAYNAPHSPMQAKEEDMAKFPGIKDKKRKIYAGMVYAVDRGVKRVVDTLKATGQYENTLIVFLSDNGGKPKLGANNYPLKGQKGTVNEGGFRTPMLFHWPKGLSAGQTFKHPVMTLDFYPTFAALAGAKIPEHKALDGKNIFPYITKGTSPHEGKSIYVMRHRLEGSDVSAVRDNWKAVKTEHSTWQLFDLNNDIGETKDLSAKHPNILREMVVSMKLWSWTNTQPLWFHIPKEGFQWREYNMPRFHETFDLNTQVLKN